MTVTAKLQKNNYKTKGIYASNMCGGGDPSHVNHLFFALIVAHTKMKMLFHLQLAQAVAGSIVSAILSTIYQVALTFA